MSQLEKLCFYQTESHPCSYLEDQQASTIFMDPEAELNAQTYEQLSQLGFRRSGSHVYRPHCDNCQACIAARVRSHNFIANRRQRRILKKNADLSIEVVSAGYREEHYLLYERYINLRHSDGDMFPPSKEQYKSFLCEQSEFSELIEFRLGDALLGVAVTDSFASGLSAIYTFFCPEQSQRSLGVFSILKQIELSSDRGKDYLYLGYWIKNCAKMTYKSEYRPLELLINQNWLEIK